MVDYSCGQNLARVFLVIFNLIFVLTGLGLAVIGGLLKGGAEFLDVVGDFVKQIPEVGNIAIGLIVLGCVIFLIGIFGMCGSCCSVKCMLVLYSVFVIIITIAEIVTVSLLLSGKLDKTVSKGFSKLTEKYKMPTDLTKIDADDLISRLIDAVFIIFKCCDYQHIDGASKNKIPPSCCTGLDRSKLESGDISSIKGCYDKPSPTNSYIDKECGAAFVDLVRNNKSYAIGITSGLVVVELLCIIFSCWICNQIGKNNKVSTF